MKYDAQPDALDRELVLEFFWRFSSFECALKREDFLRSGREAAEPDWDKFAQAIGGRFDAVNSSEFRDALRLLSEAPPRKQVVIDRHLRWREQRRDAGEPWERFILRMVRTVRNNLFHGGKYPDGPIEEVARNRDLLRAALTVLDACADLHPSLRHWLASKRKGARLG